VSWREILHLVLSVGRSRSLERRKGFKSCGGSSRSALRTKPGQIRDDGSYEVAVMSIGR
jgi:hypothetical protein